MPRVTLFIPVHDERDSLLPTAHKALQVLSGVGADFELLIVDDGSRDGSAALADELAGADPRVRVLHHERNRGYGHALRSGFQAARGELVAYTDCDEPADLRLLPDSLKRFEVRRSTWSSATAPGAGPTARADGSTRWSTTCWCGRSWACARATSTSPTSSCAERRCSACA